MAGLFDKLAEALRDMSKPRPSPAQALRGAEMDFLKSQKELNAALVRVAAAMAPGSGASIQDQRLLELEKEEAEEKKNKADREYSKALTLTPSSSFGDFLTNLMETTETGRRAKAISEGNVGEALGMAAGGFQKAAAGLGKTTLGAGASGVVQGVTALGMVGAAALGAPEAAPVIGIFGELVAGVAQSIDTIRDWTRSLHNSDMQFAEFSGSMAAVQAQQEVRDIFTSITRGERRSKTAGEFAEAMTNTERAVAPFEDWFVGAMEKLFIDYVAPIAIPLQAIAQAWGLMKVDEKEVTMQKMLEEAADPAKNGVRAPHRFR